MKRQSLREVLMRNLTLYILLVIFLMVLIVMSITVYEMNQQIEEETESVIDIVERQVNHNFHTPRDEMELVSLLYHEGHFDLLQELIAKESGLFELIRVEVLSPSGEILEGAPYDPSRIGFDLSRSEGYKMMLESEASYQLGNMVFDSSLGFVALTVGIRDEDHIIIGHIDSDRFSRILEDVDIEEGHIAITDRLGHYVAHTESNYVEERRRDERITDITSGSIENGDKVEYGGDNYRLTYRQLDESGMYVLYYQDESAYSRVIITVGLSVVLLMILFIPIFIIVISRFVNRIQSGLNSLTVATQAIASGIYDSDINEVAYVEFYALIDNFKLMSAEIANREEQISTLNDEIEDNYYMTISVMAKAIEAKDQYTGNHCERVRDLSMMIGEGINLSAVEMRELKYGSILHDIGKLGIPENVLNKPGQLTDEEFALIKRHSQMGYDILTEVPLLKSAKDIILYHHESYDGSGYPAGLSGEDIPLVARIVSIADAYDAMTSKRPYRDNVMTSEVALEEVLRCSGSQFDPLLVQVFAKVLEEAKQTNKQI